MRRLPGGTCRLLLLPIRHALDGAAPGAGDDDTSTSDSDPRIDSGQKIREAFLAKPPLELWGDSHVVSHSDTPGEVHVAAGPRGPALKRLPFRVVEENRHALEGDAPFHPAVAPLRHGRATGSTP